MGVLLEGTSGAPSESARPTKASASLLKLAHHHVRSIQAQVFFRGLFGGGKQIFAAPVFRIQQRPVCVSSVLIRIPEQELPQADNGAIGELIAIDLQLTDLVPVNQRLADAIDKTKCFASAHV